MVGQHGKNQKKTKKKKLGKDMIDVDVDAEKCG
jgi:hypothetical protein